MKKYKWLIFVVVIPLILSSCSVLPEFDFSIGDTATDKYNEYFEGITPVVGEKKVETVDLSTLNLEYSERDLSADYDKAQATRIVFADNGSTIYGQGAISSGKDVTINTAGVYIISGSASGAVLTVKVPLSDEVHLVLSGLSLVGKNGTALDIRSAGKLIITLEGENALSDSLDEKPSALDKKSGAVILSRESLTINGSGSLAIHAVRAHGVFSEGEVVVTGGNLNIHTSRAGIVGERCVKINGGSHTFKAEEEGILSGDLDNVNFLVEGGAADVMQQTGYIYISGGTFHILSTGDAVRAESVLYIQNGVLDLKTGVRIDEAVEEKDEAETFPNFWDIFQFNTQNKEQTVVNSFSVYSDGLSAGSDILIDGGILAIQASNHAIYSARTISLNGGKMLLEAVHSGVRAEKDLGVSDGIVIMEKSRDGLVGNNINISGAYTYIGQTDVGVYAKGHLKISDGVLAVAGAKELPLDFAVATVTGGVLAALGNADVAREFFPTEERGVIFCAFGKQGKGYPLSLLNSDGEIIRSLEGKTDYSCAYISAPDIKRDNFYTLMSGGYVSEANRYGFAMNAKEPVGAEALVVVRAK